MVDRSSRPRRSPRRTPAPISRKVLHLRVKKRWRPARIAGRLGLVPSTVHKILTRNRVARLAWLDRATGQPVRYEKTGPGELIHVDVNSYRPVNQQPLFIRYATSACPNAEALAAAAVQLPVHPCLTEAAVAWIADRLATIAQEGHTA